MSEEKLGSTEVRGKQAFVPTLAMGVPASVIALVAANKPVVTSTQAADRLAELGTVPLAATVSILPVLAWAALLLLRGKLRMLPAAVGMAASIGTIAAASAGMDAAHQELADEWLSLGQGDAFASEYSTWFWVLNVASLLGALAFSVSLRHGHLWPAMGRKYDAPGAGAAPAEPTSNQDIWKAIDEGRDPTAPPPRNDI